MGKTHTPGAPQRKKKMRKDPAHPAINDGPVTALMSVRDLSSYLNVSRTTVRRLYQNGQIPYVQVGGRVRFDLLAVRAALDKTI